MINGIDPIKLDGIADKAKERVLRARDVANIATQGRSPEWVQLGTWNVVKARPDLQTRIKKERGEKAWTDYQAAMSDLEQRLAKESPNGRASS